MDYNESKQLVLETLKQFNTDDEDISLTLFNVYPDEMKAICKLLSDKTEPTKVSVNTQVKKDVDSNSSLHHKLVNIAYSWVLKNGSCGVAFKELNTSTINREYPDVIGFGSFGYSVLIECKTSRADFFADRKKPFRKEPSLGMGSQRFYCCPTGLIKQEELPDGWGLIYVNEKGRATAVHSNYKGNLIHNNKQDKNIVAEHGLMYSALRRLHLRGRIDEIYEPQQT
jgi:hypothetical protein